MDTKPFSDYLSAKPCACDAIRTLDGGCCYSNPPQFTWRCDNGHAGRIGFDSIVPNSKEIYCVQTSFSAPVEEPPFNMHRLLYVAHTLNAAAHLFSGCKEDETLIKGVAAVVKPMLESVWQFEVGRFKDAPTVWMKAYWDQVQPLLNSALVYRCLVLFGENVNPKFEHNVWIDLQPAKCACVFRIILNCP